MPTLKLTYFDAAGRAESIRVALTISGISFEDHRVAFPEFAGLKAAGAFPLGSVPVLTVDGVPMPQTASILRYVARLGDAGLYPTDAAAAFVVDAALDTFNDTLSNALLPSLFERDAEKKMAMRAEFAAGPMTRSMGFVESLLQRSGGPFVTGATMTIADIVIALQTLQIQSGGLDGLTTEMLAPYPKIQALAAAYVADPRVVAYRNK